MEAQAAGGDGGGPDRRLEYMGHFVTKTLKLKPEKWHRVITLEEHKNVIKEFIDRPIPMVLIIVLTPAAQLVPSSTFPLSQLKSKGVYFVKKQPEPVPREDCKHFLVMGDLATRSIDQLSTLVDEVFVPLLSNEDNYKGWPVMVAQDVQKHVHSLKSTVHQVKGQVSGQTILAMPVGVEKIVKAAKELLETKECFIDLYLKSAIEGVVIKWATQINDVMKESPSNSFSNGQNPVPASEIHFWSSRLTNLSYIFEQLRNERIRAMALILEHTDSAYYPCFKTLFKNVVTALAEAKDITLYLNPVKKHFSQLEEIDFAECKPLLVPLMHVICLLWGNSRYYCHSSKITILLKQTCNLIIHQAKRFLDPSSIFHSDIDEAMQRLTLCIKTLKFFRDIFDYYKENLEDFFREEARPPIFWTFHPNAVFSRFDAFLDRLNTIQWFFFTVIEFLKLEKVEIGGLRGRQLSARITAVYVEFNQYFTAFASKSYDVLDPDDPTFNDDFVSFQTRILELDMKLAAILCQAFDDCHNLESIFKLINIVGSVLERPKIKEEFTNKYSEIVKMLDDEMTMCEAIFEAQINLEEDKKYFFFGRNCPPVTACLRWCQQLSMRITSPVKNFQALQHPIVQSEEGLALVKRYEELITKLGEFENSVSKRWADQVTTQIVENLQKSLIDRDSTTKMLILNFSPQLFALLREVHYLKQMEKEGIPENGIEFSEKSDIYRSYTLNLEKTIDWYNEVLINSTAVELELIKNEIEQIDALVEIGVNELNWNSENITDYLQRFRDPVASLQNRMKHTQGNLAEIRNIMSEWARIPLFERKDSKKDTVLCLEERAERKLKRYNEIEAASEKIHNLLADNMIQFSMQNRQNEQMWQDYVSFVDNVVYENLLLTVGVSMGYLAENMDPSNNYSPLFESRLELLEPNMIFVPSLDPDDPNGFNHLLVELMDDILKMSTLIKRLKDTSSTSYQEMIITNTDIIEMRKEILESVDRVVEEAADLCHGFERYSYLWYDDRNECMEYFLMFGRVLDPDEIDLVLAKDPAAPKESPPTIEAFREQIDNYESLFMEIEGIKPFQIFNSWFQVDVRPFRQNLLNIVCKWGNMFKQHLVNRVTNSLTDLASFIRKADEGLMQTVKEGDYDGLVSTMAYLMQVKERAVTTDEMFEPMQETIQLLKYYDMDIPEEVNVLLQELPEQWANTKKIATTVKQQVSPLQATEVVSIRNRIANFEVHIAFFREVFKNYEFFKYDCDDPYGLLNRINQDIFRLEQVMRDIQQSGSLFEVNVPEFKVLKQCRKELRMLKQLWDYVYIVRTSIEDWKTTPWRKVDVENMDIECKKFAKDIRLLDKEMRPWDTFIQLESTVKNMLTSLRAVGELQNPAIRERHWNQLMVSTKSLAALPKEVTVSVRLRMDRSEHPIIFQDDIYSVEKP